MTAPKGAEVGKPPKPPGSANGGIKLIVRRPAAAAPPEEAVKKLSLEEDITAKKAAAAPVVAKGPSELYAELVEASGGDVAGAAGRIKQLLAAGSRDAAALGGMGLREGVGALQAHGGCITAGWLQAPCTLLQNCIRKQFAAGMALLPHLVVLPPRHPGRRGILAAVSRTAAPPPLPLPLSTLPAPWHPPSPPAGLLQALVKATGEDALPLEREAGLYAYAALAREAGRPVEPFLLPMLPQVLACHADKVRQRP